jgi:hypothetical protein
MLNRALKVLMLLVGISGVVYLLVYMSAGSPWEPAVSMPLSPERIAYAQSPGAGLRYRVVAERSEARYRVRERLAGINFPSAATGTTSAIEGSISLDGQGRVLGSNSYRRKQKSSPGVRHGGDTAPARA